MAVHLSSHLSEDIFRTLDRHERAKIERMIQYATYEPDTLIYASSRLYTHLFVLKLGRIQVYKVSPEQRMLRLFVLEPVTIFGELTQQSDWNLCARTMTRCLIGTIQRDALRTIFTTYPQTALLFMDVIGQRLRAVENKLVDIAFKSVSQRLATILINLALARDVPVHTGAPLAIERYTHQQLAEMIGSYRETVTKVIGEFREQGLIQVVEDVMYLTDIERLYKLMQH